MKNLWSKHKTLKFRAELVLLALAVLASLSACGSSSSGDGPPPGPYSAVTGTATLHITNGSTHTIDTLIATHPESNGLYRLRDPLNWSYALFTALAPSATRDITDVFAPRAYNFCAGSGGYYACTWNFNLAIGATVPFTIQDGDFGGRLLITNSTGVTITNLYYRPHGTATWLYYATTTFTNGQTMEVPFLAGTWDFRAVSSGVNRDYTAGTVIAGFTLATLVMTP